MSWGAAIAGAAQMAGSAASIYEAHKNRKFQEDFAKNGVQYRVADLRAAGLNPILAATNGSLQAAAVPTGAMPDTGGLSNAGSAYNSAKNLNKQTDSNIALQGAQALNFAADTINKNSANELLKEQTKTTAAQREMHIAQAANLNSSSALNRVNTAMRNIDLNFYSSPEGKQVYKGNEITKHGKVGAGVNLGLLSIEKASNSAKSFVKNKGNYRISNVQHTYDY